MDPDAIFKRLKDDFIKTWVRRPEKPVWKLVLEGGWIEYWRHYHPREDTFLEMQGFWGKKGGSVE